MKKRMMKKRRKSGRRIRCWRMRIGESRCALVPMEAGMAATGRQRKVDLAGIQIRRPEAIPTFVRTRSPIERKS